MDLSSININDYDLVAIDNVNIIHSDKEETLYDITVEDNHTFFISLPNTNNELILAHNCDGSHITSMLIGWFKRFAPNLFNEGKICKLITPNIILEDSKGKMVKYFMNLTEFKKWEATNKNNKYKIVYLKGLGSWDRQQLIDLIDNNGLENFILEYHLDDESAVYIEDWLGNDAEKRKKYLREYSLDINQV